MLDRPGPPGLSDQDAPEQRQQGSATRVAAITIVGAPILAATITTALAMSSDGVIDLAPLWLTLVATSAGIALFFATAVVILLATISAVAGASISTTRWLLRLGASSVVVGLLALGVL